MVAALWQLRKTTRAGDGAAEGGGRIDPSNQPRPEARRGDSRDWRLGRPAHVASFLGHSNPGVKLRTYVPELRGDRTTVDLSWHISDHYPLWVEFAVPST